MHHDDDEEGAGNQLSGDVNELRHRLIRRMDTREKLALAQALANRIVRNLAAISDRMAKRERAAFRIV